MEAGGLSTQETSVLGMRQSNIDMADGVDLVSKIQELADEIENMDGASSGLSDHHRLSPGAKATVLWAKRRFPRQGIRSARKVGPQRKFGFGATARVAITTLPMRPVQVGCTYTEAWGWPRTSDENIAIGNTLASQPALAQVRWKRSAASLSGESECSIGTIAAPLDRESVSDVEDIQPDFTKSSAHQPLVSTKVVQEYGNSADLARNELPGHLPTEALPPAQEPDPADRTVLTSVSESGHGPHKQKGSTLVTQDNRKQLVRSLKRRTSKSKRVVNRSSRPRAKSIDKDIVTSCFCLKYRLPNGASAKTAAKPNLKPEAQQLCRNCAEPIKKREVVANWSVEEWDQFWTKVSCAASDIRTLREHGLEDKEACAEFLRSFRKLINIPFL